MQLKAFHFGFMALFSVLSVVACSDSNNYDSIGPKAPPKVQAKKSVAEASKSGKPSATGESVKSDPKGMAGPEFFSLGKSLDLHVIMDKSGSLWVDPAKPRDIGTGSDPTCKRMDALLDFLDSLKAQLTRGEFVRLTVVIFGSGSSSLGTLNDVMKLPRDQVDNQFRTGVCENNGQLETTNYARGIRTSVEELKKVRSERKLEVESNIFFSDGAAKDRPSDLTAAIDELNTEFPQRIFGILLGNTTDNCALSEGGKSLSTLECITKVVGGSADRIIQTNDAAGLSAAMISLLKK